MGFVEPAHDDQTVDLAGNALIGNADALAQLDGMGLDPGTVINNWRAAHAYPLNTFQMTLRNRTSRVDPGGIVAQRIKRLSSIENKLRRYEWLTLSEMQDIAGARVIVNSVQQVYDLVHGYEKPYSSHKLLGKADYIRKPKSDGYRSYHLIYCYSDPRHAAYDDLKVELQFRSKLQHCWATAVETADIFYKEGLKAHRGSPQWRRFFVLMETAIALREGCRSVPRTPKDAAELKSELRECANYLDVSNKLTAFGSTLNVVGKVGKRFKYVIMVLDPRANEIKLYGYAAGALEEATAKYSALERYKAEGADAVLVSVSDAAALQRAYPNYFLDTTVFVDALREAIA